METFSQRIGKKPIKKLIQEEEIDDDLKNALWNAITIYYWDRIPEGYNFKDQSSNDQNVIILLVRIWLYFFKKRIDEMPVHFSELKSSIKSYFFGCPWNELYDLIEFIVQNHNGNNSNGAKNKFIKYCNEMLEQEVSGFRLINEQIAPVSSKIEIESIEEAVTATDTIKPVTIHLNRALELFSDRENPDYRNSIKESISAVEAYCSHLTNKPGTTLGQALGQLEKGNTIHKALKSSFSHLYGWTSDADGIRHALLEENNLNQEDAKFMLVSCSAFINYLRQKESKI